MRVLSSQLKEFIGKEVECAGWVHGTRELGKVGFIILRDRRGKMQATVKGNLVARMKELGLEDVISLKGIAREDERVKGGAELEVSEITVLNKAEKPLPVDIAGKTETSFEARFDHRTLDLRGERQQAIFRVQNTICAAYREYLLGEGFTEIHTPKIIATGTEGGANLFPVVYFEKEAFLAQSPQFYKQMLVGAGFERVFETAPVYRAEEHDTPFHLNEYMSLDMEMGFIKDEEDVMKTCSGIIAHIFKKVNELNKKELELFNVTLPIPKVPFPIVHYWDLPSTMEQMGKKMKDQTGDLERADEEALCEYSNREWGSELVFIDNYPAKKRPAYTMPYEKNPEYTRGYDLLYRGLEIVTGGQRIHQVDLLRKRFKEKGYNPDDFEFYFEVFRFGMPPHGGQAIGLERLTMKILGLNNIREAAFFPRDRKRLYP
ncbi:aspartate--tRNA(Asn) ligase [Candidatus Micrarchaeota archaeon]|nr:aspartate--tRNA(Asn) ligase [Candidatus Micrarchaeota archaeon]